MSINHPKTRSLLKATLLMGAGLSTLAIAPMAAAQAAETDAVIVTGIRQSLENALAEQRKQIALLK